MESTLLHSAIAGTNFLNSLIDKNGKFTYGYDIIFNFRGKITSFNKVPGYNMLRHAGSLWSLIRMCYILRSVDPVLRKDLYENITNSVNWMIDRIKQINGSYSALVEGNYAKLGGAGLAALVLDSYGKEFGINTYYPIVKELCQYILTCTDNQNDLFFTKHKFNVKSKQNTKFISNFYPGEALLALATVTEFKEKVSDFFESYKKYRDSTEHIRDHWMAQAISSFYQDKDSIPDNIIDYINKIAEVTLKAKGQRTGPMACRSESLLACYNVSKNKMYLSEAKKLINIQLTRQLFNTGEPKLDGAFIAADNEAWVRNDINQHNICSFIPIIEEEEIHGTT